MYVAIYLYNVFIIWSGLKMYTLQEKTRLNGTVNIILIVSCTNITIAPSDLNITLFVGTHMDVYS